ncbi:unnamed protein product, partial [Rangifer tarandus platyrhynchus]
DTRSPIYDITSTVYDISSPIPVTSQPLYLSYTVYDNTYTVCLIWHSDCIYDITLYVYDISTLYGITHRVMTTQPLCNFTATMSDITHTLSVSSHPMYQFYQAQCMYGITATILFMTSHALYSCNTRTIYDSSYTVYDNTYTVFLIWHSDCIYDITLYVYDISTLYGITHRVMTTQPL